MIDVSIVKIIGSIVLACLGWYIVHYLTTRRDIKAKKRELATKYQIETFIAINTLFADIINVRTPPNDVIIEFNKAISTIQILGNESQITRINRLIEKIQELPWIQTSECTDSTSSETTRSFPDQSVAHGLLRDLRDKLRRELELSPINGNITSIVLTIRSKK